jgi:hypothetical protein
MCRSQKPGLTRTVYQRLRIEVGPQDASFGSAANLLQPKIKFGLPATETESRDDDLYLTDRPIIDCFVYTRCVLCRHLVTTSLATLIPLMAVNVAQIPIQK